VTFEVTRDLRLPSSNLMPVKGFDLIKYYRRPRWRPGSRRDDAATRNAACAKLSEDSDLDWSFPFYDRKLLPRECPLSRSEPVRLSDQNGREADGSSRGDLAPMSFCRRTDCAAR